MVDILYSNFEPWEDVKKLRNPSYADVDSQSAMLEKGSVARPVDARPIHAHPDAMNAPKQLREWCF